MKKKQKRSPSRGEEKKIKESEVSQSERKRVCTWVRREERNEREKRWCTWEREVKKKTIKYYINQSQSVSKRNGMQGPGPDQKYITMGPK